MSGITGGYDESTPCINTLRLLRRFTPRNDILKVGLMNQVPTPYNEILQVGLMNQAPTPYNDILKVGLMNQASTSFVEAICKA